MVRAIYADKVAQHVNPVPNAAVHRGVLVTSGILGKDLQTGTYPTDKTRQVALVFDYFVAILEAGGATLQDVVKLDLYLTDKADRGLVNPHWERLWPDPSHRPARQAHHATLPAGCCLQAVATAILEAPT